MPQVSSLCRKQVSKVRTIDFMHVLMNLLCELLVCLAGDVEHAADASLDGKRSLVSKGQWRLRVRYIRFNDSTDTVENTPGGIQVACFSDLCQQRTPRRRKHLVQLWNSFEEALHHQNLIYLLLNVCHVSCSGNNNELIASVEVHEVDCLANLGKELLDVVEMFQSCGRQS